MPVNDIYRATIAQIINGVNVANVMHFQQLDDEAAELAPDSLKAALETIILPTWVPMLSNNAKIDAVSIKQILPATDQPFVYAFTGGTGTVAQESEPPNLAVVATIYSDDNQRKGRGRNYFAGIATTLIEGATPKAAFVSLFATFKTALMSSFQDAGSAVRWTLTHYSPFDNAYSPVIHIEQRMQLRVLRSRITN